MSKHLTTPPVSHQPGRVAHTQWVPLRAADAVERCDGRHRRDPRHRRPSRAEAAVARLAAALHPTAGAGR